MDGAAGVPADRVVIGRPGPGEIAVASVAADGAVAWVIVPAAVAADGELLAQFVPILAQAQDRLRETAPR